MVNSLTEKDSMEYRKFLNRAKIRKDLKNWDDCGQSFNVFLKSMQKGEEGIMEEVFF